MWRLSHKHGELRVFFAEPHWPRSEPFGITVDAQGDPWYAMMSANKIAEFQLR